MNSTHPFAFDYAGDPFVFFSTPHWSALGVLVMTYIVLWYLRDWFKDPKRDKWARWTIGSVLILQEFSLSVWRMYYDAWTPGTGLPLHLCGMGIVLGAVWMFKPKYLLYELVYFWGLGGAIQACLTPNIGEYGYPHYRYFQFFVSHGVLIFASLYMTFVAGMRPTHKSIWKVFGLTNAYMVFIAGFNWLTDGNYLFICYKPPTGSIMDAMGPWPWYILVLEVVAVISFYIYYLPFAFKDLVVWFKNRP